jgi:hypothetical protein
VHGAIRLDDGRVLITGGTGSGAGMTAEYFEPATGTFVALPPMTADYGFWGVIERMTDGRIYIQHEGAAQLFTPATNTFTPAGNAGVGAIFSAGAALSNRRVLVAGGQDFIPFTFVSREAARIFIPNESPVANAGDDRQVSPGAGCTATFTLNGASSSDPDGDSLTYAWTYAGAPVGSAASLDISIGQGTHTFTLTVSDGNGGTASDEVIIVVADSMPPSFVAPLPVSMSLEQAGPAGTFFAIAAPSATDHCDAAPVVSVSGVPAGSIFPAGATDVTFTATDANGNDASMTITITVGDSVAPALDVPGPISAEAAGPSGTSVTYSVSATDAVTASPAISCSPASGSTFPITTTTVECSATDAAGNRRVRSFPVTISDTIAPVVSVPGPISVEATGPSGAAVSYSVSATDAVAGSPAVTCTRATGSVFPIGATLVECWATDAAGNRGDASFEVSVADSTGPDITSVSSNPGSLWPPNHKMVPVRITALTGEASECRITSVSSNQPSDDDWQITGMLSLNLRAERLGSGARTYTVNVRCTDAAGNASMGATTVIVPHDQRK